MEKIEVICTKKLKEWKRFGWLWCWWSTLKVTRKERKTKTKKTYLPLRRLLTFYPYRRCTFYLKESEAWQMRSSSFLIYTIKWRGELYYHRMDIHHHKPSTALARIRQLRGIDFIWIHKHKRGKQTKTRIEKKRKPRFDSNYNRRKDHLHRCHLHYKLALIPPWKYPLLSVT